MTKPEKTSKGFTLVEFLFVAFTMALFMTALFRITQGGLQAYQRGVVQTELKHELRNIIDNIATDIRQATPGDFTAPARSYGALVGSNTLSFRRYKYTADNTVPQGDIQVTYAMPANNSITFPYVDNNSITDFTYSPLTKTVVDGGNTVTTTLSEYAIKSYQLGMIKVAHIGSTFTWATDPLHIGYGNLDVMRLRLTIFRTHSGSMSPETVQTETFVALRAGKSLAAGSNYYPPTVVTDPYANLQRFGNPTSLIKP